ncbi:MAG TPA: helix-turn-helix domain-containing protein [Candidatus Elarobacter sp.]
MIRALIDEDPEREADLKRGLEDRSGDPDRGIEFAVSAWGATTRPAAAVVFERIDVLEPAARPALKACLGTLAARSIVIACSRASIGDVVPARIPPGAVVALTERDMRLTLEETRAMVGADVDEETLGRIDAVALGWPLALEVLNRGRRRDRLERLLTDPYDFEFGALHSYVTDQILDPLPADDLDLLHTLCLAGPCTPAELAELMPPEKPHPLQRLRELPLVRIEENRASVHPVLCAVLAMDHLERRRAVARRACDIILARGAAPVRAARIALAGGDAAHAADVLEASISAVADPHHGAAEIVEMFDPDTLMRHPSLWNATMIYRLFAMRTEVWQREARAVWSTLTPQSPVDTIVGVATNVLSVHAECGEWREFARFNELVEQRYREAGYSDHPLVKLGAALTAAWIKVQRMEDFDLTALMREIAPLLSVEYVHALVLCHVVAAVHAARGKRTAQRSALDEALIRARRCSVPSVLAMCLQESAITAWLADESALFAAHVEELEALVEAVPALRGGAAHFLDCARGRGALAREGGEKPPTRALSWLIAAGTTRSSGERRAFLDEALRTADGCGYSRARILTRLAMAAALPGVGTRWEEAQQIAAAVDAPFFQRFFESGIGAERLEPFLSRFRFEEAPEDRVVVRVLEGLVEVEGKVLRFSPKELALIAMLSLHGGPIDGDTLCEELWPESPLESAAKSLRVYVTRVRKKVRDGSCIEVDKGRYRAANYVRTDLDRIHVFMRTIPARPSQNDISVALQRYDAMLAGPPAFLVDLPAFATLNAHVNELLDLTEEWLRQARARSSLTDRARIDLALNQDAS